MPSTDTTTTTNGETSKVALITGITGQDGSYLSEILLEKGYIVYGIIRRSSSFNTSRIEHLYKDPHVQSREYPMLNYVHICTGDPYPSTYIHIYIPISIPSTLVGAHELEM